MSTDSRRILRKLVAEVAAAYFSANHARSSDIPDVIGRIAEALGAVGASERSTPACEAPASPARVRASIREDALISFEDGRAYRTLGPHLAARGLSAREYRAKWGLPEDYPTVAPSYSKARSRLAKRIGLSTLGTRARQTAKA